jgi:hypothetical protein
MEFGEVHPHRVFERHGERAGVDAELRHQGGGAGLRELVAGHRGGDIASPTGPLQ